MARSQAIRAGVAAADDDNALAGGENRSRIRNRVAFAALVLLRQKFHREVNTLQFASRNVQIPGLFRAAGKQNRVEVALKIFNRHIFADVRAGDKCHAFRLHLFQAAIENRLFQLEVRNSIAQQSADAVGLLEDRHRVSGATQLLRSGQSCRSGTNDRDALAGRITAAAQDESSPPHTRAR